MGDRDVEEIDLSSQNNRSRFSSTTARTTQATTPTEATPSIFSRFNRNPPTPALTGTGYTKDTSASMREQSVPGAFDYMTDDEFAVVDLTNMQTLMDFEQHRQSPLFVPAVEQPPTNTHDEMDIHERYETLSPPAKDINAREQMSNLTPASRDSRYTTGNSASLRENSMPGAFDNMDEDAFIDVDSIRTHHLPARRSHVEKAQPSSSVNTLAFRPSSARPRIYEPASLADERAYFRSTSRRSLEATPSFETPPAKRKRGDRGSVFRTPSRSYPLHNGDNHNGEIRGGSNAHITPPASVNRTPRTLDPNSPPPTSSDLDVPFLDSVTTTLDILTHTINDMHKEYQKPMEDLARTVNTLCDRLIEVEAENGRLRAHVDKSFEKLTQQTNRAVRDMDKRCAEVLHSNDEVVAQHNPVAGGAYGGPARTLPSRQPSNFADLISNIRRLN